MARIIETRVGAGHEQRHPARRGRVARGMPGDAIGERNVENGCERQPACRERPAGEDVLPPAPIRPAGRLRAEVLQRHQQGAHRSKGKVRGIGEHGARRGQIARPPSPIKFKPAIIAPFVPEKMLPAAQHQTDPHERANQKQDRQPAPIEGLGRQGHHETLTLTGNIGCDRLHERGPEEFEPRPLQPNRRSRRRRRVAQTGFLCRSLLASKPPGARQRLACRIACQQAPAFQKSTPPVFGQHAHVVWSLGPSNQVLRVHSWFN